MASIKDLKRMCKGYSGCDDCPLSMEDCRRPDLLPDNADKIVDKWVSEHPTKTYAMDFFEKFPNAARDHNGLPGVCWKQVYGGGKDCPFDECIECWDREMDGDSE